MTPVESPATRERILDVALELFAGHGYQATTTREITGRLGITAAALYYHFSGKEDCLVALVGPYLAIVERLLANQGGPLATETEARAFLSAYQEVISAHDQLAWFIDRDPAVTTNPELGPRVARLTEELRTLLAGPDPDDTDLVRASAALGALRRPTLRLSGTPGQPIEVAVDAAVSALGPRGGGRRRTR